MAEAERELVKDILKKIPRPNYAEMPLLYQELDEMTQRIGEVLISSKLFDSNASTVCFDKATKESIIELINRNHDVMIPFFVMICGFSVRELERLYGIHDVYALRERLDSEGLRKFAEAVVDNLRYPLKLETVLYKFYKNWEEHQKRHYRGKRIEKYVIDVAKEIGFNADKLTLEEINGSKRDIDCAIPPDPTNLKVAIQVRTGVLRDLVKRAKEFSTEFDEVLKYYPNIKFGIVYFVPQHEAEKREEIRKKVEHEREGKRPYDFVIVTSDLEELKRELTESLKNFRYREGRTSSSG